MRQISLLAAFISLFLMRGFSQVESVKSNYLQLDTLVFYDVELEVETYHGRTTYWVDRKEVSKKTYDTFNTFWENVDKCKPCYLKTYEKSGRLLKEGVQYGDCNVGIWTEYYPDGKVKLKGHFKENDTQDWFEIWTKGLCSVKHGLWVLYDRKGNIVGMEKFVNGSSDETELGSKF